MRKQYYNDIYLKRAKTYHRTNTSSFMENKNEEING